MDVLKKTSNKYVDYTEILPLLRVFIEGYFHISYILSEKDLDKVKEGSLENFNIWKIWINFKKSL